MISMSMAGLPAIRLILLSNGKPVKTIEAHQVCTQLIGEYNFPNALAAITIGRFFGVETKKIDKALAEYTPQNNRSQLKRQKITRLSSTHITQTQPA